MNFLIKTNNKIASCVFYKTTAHFFLLFLPIKYIAMNFPFLYFDPGTGALVVQALAATAAAGVLFYRRIVTKVQSVFGKKQQQDLMGDIDIDENTDGGDKK